MKAKGGRSALHRAAPERLRAVPVLSVVLALVAMMLAPAMAANAAPGDLAHGVVRVDANKNGAIDASDPAGEADTGLAGVTVELLAADGITVVASTTTAGDGSWTIAEADVDPQPVAYPATVRIDTSTANGNVYASYPAATPGVNDFARAGVPSQATAVVTSADTELNALVYPSWAVDLALAGDPEGLGGLAIRTGSGPFDANDSEPGNDSGMANDRVRSADIVSFNWSLTVAAEDSLAANFSDAVFEQTIVLGEGAVANFASRPAICDAAKSSIVAQPSGAVIQPGATPPAGTTSVTLSCHLGSMGEDRAAILLPTLVQPLASSENGSTFTTTSRAYGVDAAGAATAQPSTGVDSPPIEITAAPRYDVEKINGDAGGGYYGYQNIEGVQTYGMYAYYTVQISTDRKVGTESFQQPITMEESLWAVRSVAGPNGEAVGDTIDDLQWYITQCIPSPAPRGGQVPDGLVYGRAGSNAVATAANSVRDSGTCSIARTGAADTGNYTLSMNGIDASGASYPTQTVAGASLAAGPYYVASYRVQVFIPLAEIDRTQGAPDDGVGEFSIFNRVGDFDPVGLSDTSNFGSGTEPGYCEAGPTSDQSANCAEMEDGRRSNNVVGPHTKRIAPGSWTKYFVDALSGWGGGYTWINGTGNHDGTALVQPGQTFSSMQVLHNTASNWPDAQLCDVFDNTVLKLAPLAQDTSGSNAYPADLYSAMIKTRVDGSAFLTPAEQQARQGDWAIRYGHVDLGGDDPNTGVFDLATDRYEGDWSAQRQATNGANTVCGSPDITWYDDPNDVPGGVDAVNAVWAQTAPGYTMQAGESERWFLSFEQRDSYQGGPHAGEPIPAATVAVNYGAVRTSSWNSNWSNAGYIPGAGNTTGTHQVGENGSGQGDRWTVARAQLRLQKRTIAGEVDGVAATGVADYGVTGSAVAGRPVIWEITSTLTALADPAAPVNDVRVTDVLPRYVIFDEAATNALNPGVPAPTATVNPDGTTTLVWNLGTRVPNQDLPVLRIATTTDALAPNNTVAINEARITAAGIVPVSAHRDDHTIRLEQTGELQLKKSVDKTLDLQDDEQVYTLQLKNFSETLGIQHPTVIDVLPYNGDATNAAGVNRSPASAFSGQNTLKEPPQAFEFDGTTPLAGTFFYTTVVAASVPQNLNQDTDPSIWSTTFTPNATAIKFVAAGNLSTSSDPSKSGLTISFTTDQTGNEAGDFYSNRFTAFSDTLKNGSNYQLLSSNLVSVRVLGFSVGDFIWLDLDGDGRYTAGTDRPAPAGVKVRVLFPHGDGDAPHYVETETDADGRWVVNNLPAGSYRVAIPGAMFAEGGPLEGYIAAPNAVTDPNTDQNEGVDHHAIPSDEPNADYLGGVVSAGRVELSADTDADPIAGQEPLGDNVAGLTLAPLTTDDFTNLTLDLALTPPARFTVTKAVDGDAAQWANGPYTIQVSCSYRGAAAPGYPRTLTFPGAGAQTLTAPLGSSCTATETDSGGATSFTVTPADGLVLSQEQMEAGFVVTNVFDVGSLDILKEIEGVGAGLPEEYAYAFGVVCTFRGQTVLDTTVTVTGAGGETSFRSDPVTGIPVGASCAITETGNGGADATPPAVSITIDADPETVQTAGFVNEYSAGEVSLLKTLDGDAAGDEFLAGLRYEVWVTCGLESGEDLALFYDGPVWLTPGEKVVLDVDGDPLLLPIGVHCWIDEEIADQGADGIEVNHGSYEDAAVIEPGSPDETQELALTVANTFDQASLTVSKTVVGPDPGGPYTFELVCTYPVVTGEGSGEIAPYPLDPADAKFSLRSGESRTVTVLAGVSCEAIEIDIPAGAAVTIVDSDDSTERGADDGIVAELSGTENTVAFTNTFQNPPISVTGAGSLLAAGWTALGLLVVGAALLVVRRARRGGGEA